MASLFNLVLSCCLSRRTKQLVIPDDRSRLIPATEPPLNDNPSVVVVDHQRLQQRLDTIVRSKEAQMVNVTSQIPFNLHNKPLPTYDPSSSSRSASGSITRSPNTPIRRNRKVRIRSPLQISPYHSAEASPAHSRSNSPSCEHVDANGVEELAPPILNVRLVRGYQNGYGAIARRGRALVKAVGGHLDGSSESVDSADKGKDKERAEVDPEQERGSRPDGEAQAGSAVFNNGVADAVPSGTHRVPSESLISELPGPPGQDDAGPDQNTPTTRGCPSLLITPAPDLGFRIQDVGAITLSFGD